MYKKILYGFGGLSYSVIGQTISSFFMFFATCVLGLKGSFVGLIIAISTIWDGISDSIVGYLSDNYRIGKMGKRNGYMLIATLGMSIFNFVLWSVPLEIINSLKFLWILVCLILLETFNTMFSTPYTALGNDIAKSYDDRTKIDATRTVFYLFGIVVPSVLLMIFLPNTEQYPVGQLNPAGYVKIAFVTSLICLLCGVVSSLFTIPKNKIKNNDKKHKFSFKKLIKNFLKAFKHKKLKRIIWGYVMTSIATVFLCSVGLHFFTYSLFYTSNQITLLLLGLMLGTILSQPLWVRLSKKNKKKSSLIIGIILTILSVFGIILVYFFRIELYTVSFYFMLVLIVICGIGSGAMYTLPISIYGDVIHNITNEKDDKTATFGGALTFASNIANSITQFVVGVLLDIIKFDSTLKVQTLGVQTGLALIVFVGIQTALIIGCLIFAGYKERYENLK